MELSGYERAKRALGFEPIDRVPILGGFIAHPELLTELSGLDVWANARKAAIEANKKLGTDLIVQLVLPKSTGEATEGLDGRPTNFSKQEPKKFRSPKDVVNYIETLPSIKDLRENFNFDKVYQDYVNHIKTGQEELGDTGLWLSGFGQCNFMWYSDFGYENYFIALQLYKDKMRKLFEYSGEEGRLYNQAITRAIMEEKLTPVVYGGQDICDNRGPMVSVELLDEIYFPYLRRALEPLKEAGIKIVWHSDGNIHPIIDRLIDMGIDGFQGFQEREAGMDLGNLAKLKSKAGKKLILFGSISVVSTLPFGTPEEVKKEVERCSEVAAAGGGFFLAPTSTVGPEVPKENIYTMYEHTKEYGRGRY